MDDKTFSLSQLQPFLQMHPGRGTLRVQVSVGDGAFPVVQAAVEVFVLLDGERIPLYRRYTDRSGIVEGLILPAGPTAGTQQQSTAAESVTYYQVDVFHSGYLPYPRQRVEIYDGIETILPVTLRPVLR